MSKRTLPPTASVAEAGEGARLVAPAASRNVDAIGALLEQVAPRSGNVLEIASGTGQHVATFAPRFPDLIWQPTDVDAERLASIDSYARGLGNIQPAQILDATCPGWAAAYPNQSLVLLVNLLHLISWGEARTVVTESAQSLRPGGRLVLYGPFMRQGELTSEGDVRFHQSLTAQDPEIGYKNDQEVVDAVERAGLTLVDMVDMPANNLALIAERPTA
ncbi:hypothetical protein TRL7639_01026 [Falsiruegeria litorea R37]|uniref:Methyltransferase domain protein n=1 Tax=Falsiruegeria litorea R37 TaxID=1200284 RepID=A0A1Y5RXL2_9RHOB|nr:DUF938 domain-containing protein [Falsiruegeria litorea]SLN27317.1 hypothetical protein TRL7639_01026 [Falsiruegeria litorea R37]